VKLRGTGWIAVALVLAWPLLTGTAPAHESGRPGSPKIAAASPSWPTYHLDNSRTGNDTSQPRLSSASAGWTSPSLDGSVFGEPLVLGSAVYVATINNTVYALSVSTGAILWSVTLGPTNPASFPCGNIHPLGVLSTMAIDPNASPNPVIYAVALIDTPSSPPGYHHHLFKVDLVTHAVIYEVAADAPGSDPTYQNQRGALALANGRVYVPYGGRIGDCGTYHAYVTGMNASDGGGMLYWQSSTTHNGSGAWGPSGVAVDGSGNVYVTTGNGDSNGVTNDGSESVFKLSSTLTVLSKFTPCNWLALDGRDNDIGSLGPALVGPVIFQGGKDGVAYLLNQSNLGGLDGQAFPTCVPEPPSPPRPGEVCQSLSGIFGGTAYAAPYIYVPCTNGLVALNVNTGAPSFSIAWTASGFHAESPIVAGGAVWSINRGAASLSAYDPTSGTVLAGPFALGGTTNFSSPSAGGNQVFVGADTVVKSFVMTTTPAVCTSLSSPGSGPSRGQVISWQPGRLDLFERASGSNGLWHEWYQGSWGGPEVKAPPGTGLASDAVAVSWAPGRLDAFGTGSDGFLYHWWFDGAWHSESLGNPGSSLVGQVSAVSWGPNRIDVAVRTSSTVWHRWWDGNVSTTWSAWENHGNPGVGIGDPTLVSWAPGRLDIFAVGADGKLYHQWWPGGWFTTWEGPTDPGATLSVGAPAVVAWAANRLDIVVVDVQNCALWHRWYGSTGWSAWESQGVPPGSFLISDPSLVAWSPGRLDVFAIGNGGNLVHKWYPGGSTWAGWENQGKPASVTLTARPASESWTAGR
jgi:hypothetical protein